MQNSLWSPQKLHQVSGSHWQSHVVHASVELDIYSNLYDSSLSIEELAKKIKASHRGLSMLLRALHALDLLEKKGDQYKLTSFSRQYLCQQSDDYMGYIIKHQKNLVEPWMNLDHAVVSGKPQRKSVSHEPTEEERESFLMGMFNSASRVAPIVTKLLPIPNAKSFLDLGGGPGTYAVHFCLQNPQLKATVFDLPTSKPFADKIIKKYQLENRVNFAPGDFIQDELPAKDYDVILLSHVLHGEGDKNAEKMIEKSYHALQKGGQIIIHEFILNDEKGPVMPALFSLNMLVMTEQGKSYKESELAQLLKKAGFNQIEHLSLGEEIPSSVIRAFKN